MPALTVGRTRIEYQVRFSPAARRKSIVVTPGRVEVVAPPGVGPEAVAGFVEAKRRWVFDKVAAVAAAAARAEAGAGAAGGGPSRYASGAKLLYRGRRVRLTVTRGSGAGPPTVQYGRGFVVEAPAGASDRQIQGALAAWMKAALHREITGLIRTHAPGLGVEPRQVRIRAMKGMWASCGAGGILHFDPALAQVPRPVLEYAVVHELVHLRHRSHSPGFWRALAQALPDGPAAARWLEAHGRSRFD